MGCGLRRKGGDRINKKNKRENKDKKTKRVWNSPARPNPKETGINLPNANVECKFYLMCKGPGPGTPLYSALTDAVK